MLIGAMRWHKALATVTGKLQRATKWADNDGKREKCKKIGEKGAYWSKISRNRVERGGESP